MGYTGGDRQTDGLQTQTDRDGSEDEEGEGREQRLAAGTNKRRRQTETDLYRPISVAGRVQRWGKWDN